MNFRHLKLEMSRFQIKDKIKQIRFELKKIFLYAKAVCLKVVGPFLYVKPVTDWSTRTNKTLKTGFKSELCPYFLNLPTSSMFPLFFSNASLHFANPYPVDFLIWYKAEFDDEAFSAHKSFPAVKLRVILFRTDSEGCLNKPRNIRNGRVLIYHTKLQSN